ncbi:TonB-dependent receptor [Saprospiraceae bacterium]|nr:TonB-dependent receptor [Saprospiraceae bacterium]MDA9325677.1 TonB-dependent receptor [bacterium]
MADKSSEYQILKTEQKSLEINLNNSIYGTFAEIGAGQEVARNFFQVGAAAGTIAKTMSAYDKNYSDAIYGIEESGRYVCESRLYKMLDHEYGLMEERLSESHKDATFFAFADTVAAINYSRTIKGNGWLGIRFQTTPGGKPNDLVIHTRMMDNNNPQQQEAVGILGVNLIYACFHYANDPESFIRSLDDGIKGRVMVDLVRLSGPSFKHIDNRVLGLYLVKHGLTEVTIFDENSQSVHASEFLYKKSLMVVRGNFKPPTLVTADVFMSGFNQFIAEESVDPEKAYIITELTMDYLFRETGRIEVEDFVNRADLLCALGHKVIISNCNDHQALINYMNYYRVLNLGLVIGVKELQQIITEKYEQNQDGRLLVAMGELFTRHIKVYAYPKKDVDDTLITAANMSVPEGIKFLYKHLLDSKQIKDIKIFNKEQLSILPWEVRESIASGKSNWEKKVPMKVKNVIKKKSLFGYIKSRN